MFALVETPSGTFVSMDMGEPECGEDFCDECGDCFVCYCGEACADAGGCTWVIYAEDSRNPLTQGSK